MPVLGLNVVSLVPFSNPRLTTKRMLSLAQWFSDVGKGWHFSIIAHAVNTGLCQLKDDCLLVGIIVGLGDPLGLTISIHRNRIEVAGLLVLCRCVRNGNADSLSIQVAQLGFLGRF